MFAPSAPTEYNAALNAKLDAGSAGDLITCRPFDASLELYNKGQLADLTDLAGDGRTSPTSPSPPGRPTTARTTFCVPMASVIHGFIYNKDAFDELGITPPTTEAEFFAALDKIKADGTYIPMAMGTNDQWEAATMGYQNIGPNYWKGEEGRLALINGTQKLTDPQWVAPFAELAKWKPYLGDGFEAQTYPDSQNLFTLGRAAIYPAGSWEISPLQHAGAVQDGRLPAAGARMPATPATSPTTSTSRIGLNAATPERRRGQDLPRLGRHRRNSPSSTPTRCRASSRCQPTPVELEDPLAQEFVSWREKCKSTIRSTYQILSRGTPNLENETWNASANVINGTETPEAAAKQLQDGLDSWYKPAAEVSAGRPRMPAALRPPSVDGSDLRD